MKIKASMYKIFIKVFARADSKHGSETEEIKPELTR
jgi:hypothetical protein